MTTPHRGLPPPPAMALPSPPQASSGIGQLPHQWHGSEDMYKTWLLAKVEEERRKAEEEKTKQEKVREETRRIELEMLRESSRFLIPPPLIPIVLAGGGTLRGAGGELLNEYISQHMGHLIQQQQMVQQQPQHHQQQAHQMPSAQQCTQAPALRRETRVIGQQGGGPTPHPQQMGPPPQVGMVPPQGAQAPPPLPLSQGYNPVYPPPPGGQRSGPQQPPPHPPPPPMQQSGPLSRLPKLDTNDQGRVPHQPPVHTGMPLTQHGGHPVGPPIQHTPQSSQQPLTQPETSVSQSPSIFFHHWQPPHSTSGGTSTPVQATASPQGQLGSPFNRQPQPNQITGPEYTNSPKKRKTSTQQGPSAAAPPQPFSPSFPVTPLPTNTRTRRGHSRQRSDTAGSGTRGYEPYPKAPRGHRRSIEGPHEGGPPSGGNGGGSHHPHDQHQHEQHQHQQHQQQQHQQHQQQQHQHQHHQQHQRPPSVPPHPLPQHRPFSPKSEGRRETYQPPTTSQPPPSEGGEGDNRSKSRNSNGRD